MAFRPALPCELDGRERSELGPLGKPTSPQGLVVR